MQITGQMIHEAFLKVSGEGLDWQFISDAARDRYDRMATIINRQMEIQQSVERLRDEGLLEEQRDLISGNWILVNKEDNRMVAVCIVEDSPSCYMAAKQQMYLKANWQATQPCSDSLVW